MRHDSVCNAFQVPTVISIIVAKKTTTWGESGFPSEFLVLQRRVVLQGNSWADFEAGNERVRVSHDERSVAEEEDLSVFSHNA